MNKRDAPMSKIFISYRRSDSRLTCDRIYASLGEVFGVQQVFRDLDAIPGGADFRTTIEQVMRRCRVVLVLVGPTWLTCSDQFGRRRLDDPNDNVRLEIERALGQDMPVIPLLVQQATMPQTSDLPPSLRPLAFRNARLVRPDPDYSRDLYTLTQDLLQYVPLRTRTRARPWTVALRGGKRAVALVITMLSLLLTVLALATWVHIPFVSDLLQRWLGS